jgi:hypothetical protein
MQGPIAGDFASQLSIRFRERNGAFEIAALATTAIARLHVRARNGLIQTARPYIWARIVTQ